MSEMRVHFFFVHALMVSTIKDTESSAFHTRGLDDDVRSDVVDRLDNRVQTHEKKQTNKQLGSVCNVQMLCALAIYHFASHLASFISHPISHFASPLSSFISHPSSHLASDLCRITSLIFHLASHLSSFIFHLSSFTSHPMSHLSSCLPSLISQNSLHVCADVPCHLSSVCVLYSMLCHLVQRSRPARKTSRITTQPEVVNVKQRIGRRREQIKNAGQTEIETTMPTCATVHGAGFAPTQRSSTGGWEANGTATRDKRSARQKDHTDSLMG